MARSDRAAADNTVGPYARARNVVTNVVLAIRQGDLPRASSWSDKLAQYADTIPFYHRPDLSRILIARGEKRAAAEQLRDLYEETVRGGAPELTKLIVSIRVHQALAADGAEEAFAFLSEALVKAEPGGFIRTFVDEGKLLKPLLRKALSQGITPAYTAKLLNIIETEERQRQARTGSVPARQAGGVLSDRELETLRLIEAGLSNRQIAERLVIGLSTAKKHVHNIFEKLNAKTRTQAIARARALNLI